jgi:hypothetical protein
MQALRAGSVLLALVASASWAACVDSDDPSAAPVGNDAGVDAGGSFEDAGDRDAQPDLDARATDANELIDARLTLDGAALDSGLYLTEDGGRCFFPVSNSCAPRRAPAVRCGTDVCSGATPVCCRQGWSNDIPPVCVAEGALCAPVVDGGYPGQAASNLLDHCDDTSDCEPDEICLDGQSKGVTPRLGGACTTTCFVPPFGFSAYRYQRCAHDCECVEGQGCVDGVCATD